jgi:hypothetical protein
MAEHDTAQLVERIIRDAKIPKGSKYTAAVLLGMADTETRTLVLQHVLRASGDYLVRYVDVPIVAGKRTYRLPSRAIRLKDVERLDFDGNPQPFSAIDSAQAREHRGSGAHWYFEDNAIVPTLEPGASGMLRIRFYRWPSRLVLPEECGIVAELVGADAVNVGSTEPLGGAPSPGVLVDVVKGTPGFESLADGLQLDIVDAEALSLGAELVAEVEPGDAVCLAGTTCFPQLPVAFHDVLVEHIVARVTREMRDYNASAAATASAEKKAEAGLTSVSPRSKAERPIVNKTWF